MIGLPGPTLSDADIRLFRDTRAAGLILYRRNFETPEGLAALLDRLEAALGRRVLVATDHEGGRIVMLGRGTTIFPDNLARRHRRRGGVRGAPGTDRGARDAPARRGPHARPVPGRADRPLQPQHRHPLVRQGSQARGALRRGAHPRPDARRALGLPQALPGQGPLAARRASEAADDRLDAGGDGGDPPAAVSRGDRRRGRVPDDLAPGVPEARSQRRARHVLAAARRRLAARRSSLRAA